MKSRLFGVIALAGLAAFGGEVSAQEMTSAKDKDKTVRSIAGDKWVITAEAGGVNHVEGEVSVLRTTGRSGRLRKGDTVAVGDRGVTGPNGRAEVLLNPGSYARIAGDSEFEFKTTALEDLQLKLTKGSAIFEVFATNDFLVRVQSPNGEVSLIESGVYRVDVAADGTGRLEVWKGKAQAGEATLKGGRVLASMDGNAEVAKFDRDDKDEFELWSRARAKELAKANSDLKDREMRNALMNSFMGGGWNTYNSFGLWVYNNRLGRYCFLPFGWGWSSPYGYGFGADIWYYRLPRVVFYPPVSNPGGNPTPPAGNPGGGVNDGRGRLPRPKQPPIASAGPDRKPPFVTVQGRKGMGVSPNIDVDMAPSRGGGFPGSRGGGVGPASAPRVQPPSAPPTRGMTPSRSKNPIN